MATHLQDSATTRSSRPDIREVEFEIDLFYLVYREGFSSVFAAQVLAPLSHHNGQVHAQLGLFVPFGHFVRPQWRNRLHHLRGTAAKDYGLELSTICTSPARMRWMWDDVGRLRRWLQKRRPAGRPYIVQCRNVGMTNIALDACAGDEFARIIFDCRGEEVTELCQQLNLDEHSRENWTPHEQELVDQVRNQTSRAVAGAAHVNCVSAAMRDYLADAYGLDASRASVIPCCPDTERFAQSPETRAAMRHQLNLSENLVVTYCGSMAWYQLPQQSLRIFRRMLEIEPRAHFLAITTQPDVMRQELHNAAVDDSAATIVSVSPQEVPRYLSAADVGLLLRDTTLVNRVASPVKFGEYMAAGLPVVISDGLGDYSDAVADHELGTVVSSSASEEAVTRKLSQLIESVRDSGAELRDNCRQYAEDNLTWARHLPQVTAVYRELVSQRRTG